MPDDLALKLSRLGNKTDEIIPKVLEAGGEVILEKVKSGLLSSLSGNSTGQLIRSLGISKASRDKNENWDIKIGFSENRNDGKSNAFLASVLEYGKVNQPPRPFVKPAKTKSKQGAVAAMVQKFDEETRNL